MIEMQFQPRTNAPQIALLVKQCGHNRHVGTCPVCQRAQLAKWQAQLTQASRAPYPQAA
jgi:hypothetical protein